MNGWRHSGHEKRDDGALTQDESLFLFKNSGHEERADRVLTQDESLFIFKKKEQISFVEI